MNIPLDQATILFIIAICTVIFAVCLFIIRTKDIQAMKPILDGIPLIQKDINEQGKDIAEIRGTLSVVPAVVEKVNGHESRISKVEDRLLVVERELHKPG